MRKTFLMVIAAVLLVIEPSFALFYPIDIPVEIRNGTFSYDYNGVPPGTLGGIPFTIPSVSNAQPYDYFAFYDGMPDTQWTVNAGNYELLTLQTGTLKANAAYLLLNTNWGTGDKIAGTVTFNTLSGNNPYTIDLWGNVNVRDWNAYWTNSFTDPRVSTVFSVQNDFYGMEGRVDMLSVALPDWFLNDPLQSIVFTDLGDDGLSRLRVEGITVDGIMAVVPEPSTLILLTVGLGIIFFWFRVRPVKI
jgi:hypothetical protein